MTKMASYVTKNTVGKFRFVETVAAALVPGKTMYLQLHSFTFSNIPSIAAMTLILKSDSIKQYVDAKGGGGMICQNTPLAMFNVKGTELFRLDASHSFVVTHCQSLLEFELELFGAALHPRLIAAMELYLHYSLSYA